MVTNNIPLGFAPKHIAQGFLSSMLIDIIVLIVILISGLISFLRGFIREILTIFGVAGAFTAAYFLGPMLTPTMGNAIGLSPPDAEFTAPQKLMGIIPYEIIATILAYSSVFIVVVIILSIASHILAESAKSLGLGAIDRSIGVVFGLLRGILLLGLLNLPIYIFAKDAEGRPEFINTAIEKSSTYFYVEQTSKFIEGFLPGYKNILTIDEAHEKLNTIKIPGTAKIIEKVITAPSQQTPEGYSEDFRDKMDKLFEEEEK